MTARKKSTNKPKFYGFDTATMPYTETGDFRVVSLQLEGADVYGVYNKMTGHMEMAFTQLSAAVIQMQTAQQTFDRVKTGEANGFCEPPSQG